MQSSQKEKIVTQFTAKTTPSAAAVSRQTIVLEILQQPGHNCRLMGSALSEAGHALVWNFPCLWPLELWHQKCSETRGANRQTESARRHCQMVTMTERVRFAFQFSFVAGLAHSCFKKKKNMARMSLLLDAPLQPPPRIIVLFVRFALLFVPKRASLFLF